MTRIQKKQITVGDIEDLLRRGIINRDTRLSVPTSWAPVAVTELTVGVNRLDQSKGTLFLTAEVEKSLKAWESGHHGAPLRGQSANALAAEGLIQQVEEAHGGL